MTESPASMESAEAPTAEASVPEAPAVPAVKRRPARKPSKPDAVLAAAIDAARNGVLEIAGDTPVGDHLGAFPEAERLVTHRFAANVPGYVGWYWFATLARVPRGKDATVCEVGLLPSEDALLAPDWVPWSERVRPEDSAEEEATTGEPAQEVTVEGGVTDGDPAEGETTDGDPAEGETPDREPTDVETPDGEPTEVELAEAHSAGSNVEESRAPGGESPVA